MELGGSLFSSTSWLEFLGPGRVEVAEVAEVGEVAVVELVPVDPVLDGEVGGTELEVER